MLSAVAVIAAALSLIVGLILLHAPARQSREALKMVLEECEDARQNQRPVASLRVSTSWNMTERVCAVVQPCALFVSIVLLAISAIS